MQPAYSIAEARQQLRFIVEETEREECVQLTRRGKQVAVIEPDVFQVRDSSFGREVNL